MSYSTTPAYIHHCNGWEDRFKEHPVFEWMFDYTTAFDKGDMKAGPYTKWHTADFAYTLSNGVTLPPGEPSWAATLELYAPFTEHFHEPRWFAVWETPNGYDLTGHARLYADLPVPGDKTKEDLSGRKWDVCGFGMFQFSFTKDESGPRGLKMAATKLYSDPSPLMGEMVKRGMVKGEDILAKMA